jgi:HPt (histidine-containing phosphotransfer) domain-containing protein
MYQENSDREDLPIDARELLDRCMDNIELAERVLSKLQSRFESDMAELERTFAGKDLKAMASVAHRLKGAAANVAAHGLRDCAAELESMAHGGAFDGLPAQLGLLRNQWTKLNESASSCLAPYRVK